MKFDLKHSRNWKGWFFSVLVFLFPTAWAVAEGPLVISKDIWVGYGPWSVADAKGLFREEGVEVNLKVFTEMIDSKRAFESGAVDAALLTLNEVLLMRDKGVEGVIILAVDYSAGADAIVAQKQIKNVRDLRGKTVGVEVGTVSHFTLLKGLEKAGLKEADLKILNIGTNDLPSTFGKKRIAAASSWEPFISKMVKENAGHVIFSSKEIPGSITDVLIVQKKVFQERKDDLAKAIRGWFRALDFLKKHPEEALKIMSKIHGTDPKEYAEELKGVHLTGKEDNLVALGKGTKLGSLLTSLLNSDKFLREHGLIKNKFDLPSLVSNEILQRGL